MKIKISANVKKEKVKKTLPQTEKILKALKVKKSNRQFDTVFVFGGDGWLLKTLAQVYDKDIGIFFFPMGENTHTPGFKIEDIKKIASGKIKAEPYKPVFLKSAHIAFNDIVIKTGQVARTIKCRLKAGKETFDWEGDGAIISTPLGSTAYNFAAGGPVVFRKLEAIIITPMISFKGFSRSIVFPFSESIEISIIQKQGDVWEVYDGSRMKPAGKKIKISAEKSKCKIFFPK